MDQKHGDKNAGRLGKTLQTASQKVNEDRPRADSIRNNWIGADIRVSHGALRKVG